MNDASKKRMEETVARIIRGGKSIYSWTGALREMYQAGMEDPYSNAANNIKAIAERCLELDKEVVRWKGHFDVKDSTLKYVVEENQKLEAENQKLREALKQIESKGQSGFANWHLAGIAKDVLKELGELT